MYAWAQIILLLPVIPWSIFAFTATLWPTTEQNNYKLLDWSRWVLTMWFISPMMTAIFNMVLEGICCNLEDSQNKKRNTRCHKISSAFNWFVDFCLAGIQCFLAILGLVMLSDMNKTDNKWFKFSMIIMNILLWLMFTAYVMFFLSVFSVTTCCKTYGVVTDKDVGFFERLILNYRHFNGLAMLQNHNNRKDAYEKPNKKPLEKNHEISVGSSKVKSYSRDNHGDRLALCRPSKKERHLRTHYNKASNIVYGFEAEATEDAPKSDQFIKVWTWQKDSDDFDYFGLPADSPLNQRVNSSTLDSMFAEIKDSPFYHIWNTINTAEKESKSSCCWACIVFFVIIGTGIALITTDTISVFGWVLAAFSMFALWTCCSSCCNYEPTISNMLKHRSEYIREKVEEYNNRFQLYDPNLHVYTPKNCGYILLSYSHYLPQTSPSRDYQSDYNPYANGSNQNNYVGENTQPGLIPMNHVNPNIQQNMNYPNYNANVSYPQQSTNYYPQMPASVNQNTNGYNPFYTSNDQSLN